MGSDLGEILQRDVVEAARALLGCDLVFGEIRARIVETEAYRADDAASHSFRGVTPRNLVMFGPPGFAYVYFSYGCHWMLNVVAHGEGDGAAVLVRAAQPLGGLEIMRGNRPKARRDEDLLSGPGKLCAGLGIDREQHGIDLLHPVDAGRLHLEVGAPVAEVLVGPRVGITKDVERPWRFVDARALPWVSRPLPT